MKGPGKRSKKIHGSSSHSLSTSRERNPFFSFYILMLQPNIQSRKLRIPGMFARTYANELSTAVILTVPTQESWKVALVKKDDKLWFRNGWEDFVEYYSIGFAYFLQFIYEGNSKFEVHIFDKTACEICYLYNACNSPQDQREPRNNHQSQQRFLRKKQHVDNDIVVETSDAIKLEIEDEPSSPEHDEQVHDDDGDDFTSGFSGSSLASDDEKVDQYDGNGHTAEANGADQGNQNEDHVWLKHEEALALVGFSKPQNPFFVAVIKERHLKRTCLVYVPAHFAQANFCHRAGKFVELEASSGSRWSVRCNKACRGCNLGAGWIHFARDNNVKAGDVCVFELVDAENYILKVHVFKQSQIQSKLLN